MIRDKLTNSPRNSISQQNQKLTSRKRKYLTISISLNLGLIPYCMFLPGSNYRLDIFIHFGIFIHVTPEYLAIVGIVASGEVLFASVVDDGDADGCQCEDINCFEFLLLILDIAT